MEKNTTFEKIFINCGKLPDELRKEKDLQHLTNQQIADETGLSIYTVNNLLAGELKNPGIFPVAIVSSLLGLSLDRLAGMTDAPQDDIPETDRLRLELGHSEEIRMEKEDIISRVDEWSKKLERSIAARDAQIAKKDAIIAQKDLEIAAARKADKPLLYILSALCLLLTMAWATYVFLDIRKPDQGLIRQNGAAPVVWIGGTCLAILLAMLMHLAVRRIRRKRR